MTWIKSQLEGGLWGLLVGDALGVPYEFHSPHALPPLAQLEMTPPPGFSRAHLATPPGTWSDDGAQALCLLDSLLDCDGFDAPDFALKLQQWHDGAWWIDGRVYDVGITTGAALSALRHGASPLEAGPKGERDNGNGSLMRVLPLVLWHQGTDEELARDARLQSRVTHGHLRAQLCCALYCLWARRVAEGSEASWDEAVALLRAMVQDEPEAVQELEFHIRPDDEGKIAGSGYVVDCLRSAKWAVEQGGYETAVKRAVSLGNDTDTTACVAGGLAGLRDGVDAIPIRWRQAMRGQEIVTGLLERF